MLTAENKLEQTLLNKVVQLFKNSRSTWYFIEVILMISPIICIIDAYFSLQVGYISEVITICSMVVVLFFIAMLYKYKIKSELLLTLAYILFFIASAITVYYDGISSGFYFYLFPFSLIYLIAMNCYSTTIKKSFITYQIVALAVFFILITVIPSSNKPMPVTLFMFRLLLCSVISAFLFVSVLFMFTFTTTHKDKGILKYKSIFSSPLDGYIVFNKKSKEIIDFNDRFVELFEIPDRKKLKDMYLSQIMFRYLISNTTNEGVLMHEIPKNWHGDAGFKTHANKIFDAYVSSVEYTDAQNEYQILSFRDITVFKDAEKKLSYYKDNLHDSVQAKTRFLSSISHELRTPLNGIMGATNLMLEQPGVTESMVKQLNLQMFSSEHMLRIINDILDFSKMDSGKMEFNKQPYYVVQMLERIIESFEDQFASKKIKLNFYADPRLDQVKINSDEVKLRQIIDNLLANALKFTLDGSVTLRVVVKEMQHDKATICFEVKDTGIGIKEDKHREIFEGFSQVHSEDLRRRFGGTGLGLTICEKLANLFDSTIIVESEFGKGSTFHFTSTFEMQRMPLKIAETRQSTIVTSIDLRAVHVLIVEDNEVNAAILKSYLQRWGIKIKEASNGIQAVELVKHHNFDLIIMDLEMPEMNGYDATKIIRESNKQLPIIAFTATLLEDMDALITDGGFNDYILKPFKPAELKKRIEMFAPHRNFKFA